jgi:hypothetical protein
MRRVRIIFTGDVEIEEEAAGSPPAAPDIAFDEPAANPPVMNVDLPSGNGNYLDAAANDVLRVQVTLATDAGFASPDINATTTLDAGDIVSDTIAVEYSGITTDGLTAYISRARLERPVDGNSDWSATSASQVLPEYDDTQPVLSSPTASATSDTTADLGVSTDLGSGTLYFVVTTSATEPTALQVKAGQTHTGAAATDSGSQAVSGTGVQSISGGATGLTASTAYYAHYMHESTYSVKSEVVASAQFTTDAQATVTLGTMANSESTADTNTYTFTDVAIGTADASRIVAAMFSHRASGTIGSVTIGGVGATLIKAQTAGTSAAYIYAAAVPTGTTATVIITMSAGSSSRCGLGLVSIYDASGVAASDSDSSTAEPASVTLTVPTNGVVIGYVWANSATTYTWTGLTERFDTAVESTLIHSGASIEYAVGGDLAISADAAGTPTDQCAVFAAWGP